ncbi:hypothetical protein ACF0H5_006666 [Mactra antiquata]
MEVYFKIVCLLTIMSGNIVNYVQGINTFNMFDMCDQELSMIISSVYQLELTLNGYAEPCETQIEAWYMYPNLMFYFEEMDLDCEDGHLEFYTGRQGTTRVRGLDWEVCGEDMPEDVFTVNEMAMRVRYVAKRRAYLYDDVSIVFTAFSKKGSCPYGNFVCENGRCIDSDLKCNDYNPCGDYSDCSDSAAVGAIIGAAIGGVCALCCLVALIVCCCCCCARRRQIKNPGTVQGTTPYVVYTAQQTGQNQQGMAQVSLHNPSYYSPTPGTVPAAPYTNITAGQQPMYPPNVTIPAYRSEVEQTPPSYAHLYGDWNNTAQGPSSGITGPAQYDNMPSSTTTTDLDKSGTGNVYEPIGQTSGEHQYENPQKS